MCCPCVLACEDDSTWSASTQHQNITCANYSPEADWSIKRSCYKDHIEHPDMVFDVAEQLYKNTQGLDVCNKCCRTCYEECCAYNQCPHAGNTVELRGGLRGRGAISSSSWSSSLISSRSSRHTLATSSFFHTCDQRYDCARKEYTELIPEIISEPVMNTTIFSTLAVLLRLRLPISMDMFGVDERLRVREAISREFRVPVKLVSISNILESGNSEGSGESGESGEFLEMSVSIGLSTATLCVYVPCEQVHITLSNTALPELAGSDIVQAPVCKLCKPEEEFVFATAGTLDDPFSCRKECTEGFYQFQGLESATCEPHSKPQCSGNQFLQEGTSRSDALCVNCSVCEGARFVAPCLPHQDTVCESCPEPAARQYWIGNQCSPACETGFVWDTRKQECELCPRILCDPGRQAPTKRDNCTHCVPCPPPPLHAHWSRQNDRFDCMWLCDEDYQLHNMTCVATHYSPVTTLAKLQPVCEPGHMAVNFLCVPCFEAAAQGLMPMQDLPQPADVDIKWQWSYGCRWQCIHAAGYWELRPENGMYWECIGDKMHTVMLRGLDMSWAANDTVSVNTGVRRQASSERSTLFSMFLILVSVPVLVLVCMVIVGIARMRWSATDTSAETEPLLNV